MFIDMEKTIDQIKKTMWQDISTAPKDRFILLFYPKSTIRKTVIGSWFKAGGYFICDVHIKGEPTHWMELPEAPKND